MKHLLKISMIVLFTLSLSAQNSVNKNSALNTSKTGEFSFKSEVIDYGTITQNSDGHRTFTFTNTGNEPIIISNVKTSCGCTLASKPNKPVMPGETAQIGVKYATNRIGSFSKTITVTSNAKEKIKRLKIKGKITPLTNNLENKKSIVSVN